MTPVMPAVPRKAEAVLAEVPDANPAMGLAMTCGLKEEVSLTCCLVRRG